MNELRLHPLTCPQCGAPGVVREGTRITECERCGARLCLTETEAERYEVVANLDAARALNAARAWMDLQKRVGMFGRPEPILIPFHQVAGRRVGVFERKVPERIGVRRTLYATGAGTAEAESEYIYREKEDTKVMVSDVEHITPAARTPWDLGAFDPRDARRKAELRRFDLVEAQRRATVYAEELTPSAQAERRYTQRGTSEIVASRRYTLFFPFWSIPVQTEAGSYEIILEGVSGEVVAWRLPERSVEWIRNWAVLALPGSFALGYGLHAILFQPGAFSPALAILLGGAATVASLVISNRPDWALRSWPDAGSVTTR